MEESLKSSPSVDTDVVLRKRSKFKPFLIFLLMVILFGMSFSFQARMGELGPIGDIYNMKIKGYFDKYFLMSGLLFGFLSGILFLFLNLFSRITGKYRYIFQCILIPISILPWYIFARHLVYYENRYADYAKAIIYYIGYPLLATTKFLFLLIVIVFAIKILINIIKNKGVSRLLPLLFLSLFLSGCLGGSAGIVCYLLPESDHCYQAAGIQESDPDACEKIKGEGFEGSNPPKDKCYLRIAENTGDLSICDKIEGGMFSYTKEECYLETSIKHENPSGCLKLSGSDKATCVDALGHKLKPGAVIEIDDQIELLKKELKDKPDPELQKQLEGLEQKKLDYLEVMSDENKKTYEELSDPLNKAASLDYHLGKIDKKSRDSLIALNNSFRDKGNPMSKKEYEAVRDMLAYKNDPNNDIENMDPTEITKLRWNEKLGNGVEFFKFWKANKTSTEQKYDEQLLFYSRMLERQEAINKGLTKKQQDFNREYKRVSDYVQGAVKDKAIDEAKKRSFGELLDLVDSDASGPVTAVLGEAIDVVKEEAKSAEFRNLVRVYNLGMQDEIAAYGGDIDKAHEAVVKRLYADNNAYQDKHVFAQYQNLLTNPDCDGSNPHCIKKDVFWKAMKKSYKYQNKK